MTDRDIWHTLKVEEVTRALGTGREGLSEEEAERRLEKFGPNELREEKKPRPFEIFLYQFKNFLVVILLFATAISALIGEIVDAAVIFVIVIAIALLGFAQEYRAEKALEALKRLAAPTASVIRDGEEKEIPARNLVPGDVILLATGDRIPADARLIEQANLQIDESSLTGESITVSKETAPLPEHVSIADRRNMSFAGTVVTYGRGKAVVTSTGMNTEFGKIAEMIQVAEKKTPLQIRLEHVGRWLGIACLAVVATVSGLGILRGHELLEMFIWGVSLAVAAVPEALPAVVTGALAIGVRRMSRRNAIVRKLPAVETLGSITVICSDKTGTLTKNEMTTRKIYANGQTIDVTGIGYEPKGEFRRGGVVIDPKEDSHLKLLLEIGTLCNDARLKGEGRTWRILGDPTEGALVVAAAKAGIWQDEINDRYKRVGEIPFSSERKRMTTIHLTSRGTKIAFVKGAPEIVLKRCSHIYRGGEKKKLTEEEREKILEMNEKMAREALRVIGMAFGELRDPIPDFTEASVENNLIFVGLVGMIDPPREEAKLAIRLCEQAGIKPIMVTGDHRLTAIAVAKELDMLRKSSVVLTGDDLDRLSDEELEGMVEDVAVYARVFPMHKIRIVKALKKRGHIVAMTGDGVNDAPALKISNIGVAMGITGTDVTKEASDMVLTDDNFATIVAAVEEGRTIYDNIKKYLAYLLSCNVAEILIMFSAFLMNWDLPLVAVQILWVNLVTDGLPALALGIDPADPDLMRSPPRDPKESVFTRRTKALIGGVALLICAGVLALFIRYQMSDGLVKGQTVAFATLVAFEMVNVFNCRSERHSIFKIGFLSNRFLVLAVAASISMQLLVLHVPMFNTLFNTVPLTMLDWVVVTLIACTILIAVEAGKLSTKS